MSFSDMLTQGLTAANIDTLMESMVNYLKDIVINTESNNVTRQQYASLLGLSISDLTAISNITANDIENIKA